MNSSGKMLTIFLVIGAILLLSLTAISVFFFQRELEERKMVQLQLEQSQANEAKLKEELAKVKKQEFLLQEKNKEADERINSLLDELDLEEGLKEEMKKEILSLKGKLEEETVAKKKLEENLRAELKSFEQKTVELEAQLKEEIHLKETLEKLNKDLGEKITQLDQQLKQKLEVPEPLSSNDDTLLEETMDDLQEANLGDYNNILDEPSMERISKVDVDLKEVMETSSALEGRILSIDIQTEFVIVDLGEEDGIAEGNVMSVYRGEEYLGDIKITRVEMEMAAADFISPLASQDVSKDDQVIMKNELR